MRKGVFQTVGNTRHVILGACLLGFAFWISPFPSLANEINFSPSISTTYTHRDGSDIVDRSQVGTLQGNEILTIRPSISMSVKGATWNGTWNAVHTQIKPLDTEKESRAINEISINNRFDFIKDRLSFTLNGRRENRNIDSSFSSITDPIFDDNEYVDVDRYTAGVSFKTLPSSDWRFNTSFNASETRFEASDLTQTDSISTDLRNGKSTTSRVQLGYGKTKKQARVQLSINDRRNFSDTRGNQTFNSISANVGVPIWRSLDIVANGFKSTNKTDSDIIRNNQLDSEYVGLGLGWRFGNRSYIEVVQNKQTRGSDSLIDGRQSEDEFLAYSLVVSPDQRNRLTYKKTQRFYGDSHSFLLTKSAKRWNISANYNESLQTRTRLNSTRKNAGIFACPEEDSTRVECELFDINNDEFEPNLVYLNFFDILYNLSEEVTLTKGGGLSFSYSHKKIKFALSAQQSEVEFLERSAEEALSQQRMFYSASIDYKLSRRANLKVESTKSIVKDERVMSEEISSNRVADRHSLSINREFTRNARGSLRYSRVSRESNESKRSENRISASYSYQF